MIDVFVKTGVKILCKKAADSILKKGQEKRNGCLFEKPMGTHNGTHNGAMTVNLYADNYRGVKARARQGSGTPGFEQLPGFYKRKGKGIFAVLEEVEDPAKKAEQKAHIIEMVPSLVENILEFYEDYKNSKSNETIKAKCSKKKTVSISFQEKPTPLTTNLADIIPKEKEEISEEHSTKQNDVIKSVA